MTRQRSAAYMIAVLAGISAIGPFSVDAYLPALPVMAVALDAPANLLQLTLSVYLLGIAVFPLVLTPLSDAFGRKPVLAVALLAYAALSGACALAPSAQALILFRLLQAAAGGAVMTIGRAMIADQYSGDALSRAMSQMMLIFTIAPVIAPLIGGLLLDLAGWPSIFIALVAYGLIGFLFALTLNETLPPERRRRYELTTLWTGYAEIAGARGARAYLYLTFWSAFFFFAMLTAAPFIYVEQFGFSPMQFGWIFAAISAAAFLSNTLNARAVMARGYGRMLRDTVFALFALAFVMALVVWTGLGGAWGIFAVMLWLMGVFHILVANTTAGLMQQLPARTGALSAVMALFRFVGGALGSASLGLFGHDQAVGFAVALAVAAGMMLMIVLQQGRQAAPA